MLDWIKENPTLIELVTGVGTLVIWLAYAQLVYSGFRRQRRPALMINRGGSKNIDALCLISNMSSEAIFLQYIMVELHAAGQTITMDMTDRDARATKEEQGTEKSTSSVNRVFTESSHEGPLESSEFLHIGSFRDLVLRLERYVDMNDILPAIGQGEDKSTLTIRLIATYGPEDRPVGAERSFDLERSGEDIFMRPQTWNTVRLSSRRQRRQLLKTINEYNDRTSSATSAKIQKRH